MPRRPPSASRDLGLRVRMVVALALSGALTLATVGLLVWVTVVVESGWAFTFFVLCFAAIGARAPVRERRRRGRRKGPGPGPRDEEHVRRILRRLAVMGDVGAPGAEVEHEPVPLCWTASPLKGPPTVHVTTGLLRTLPPGELEAVLAHELAHLINRDATVMGLLAGPPTWALRGIEVMWWKRDDRLGNRMAAVMFGSFTAPPALLLAGSARIVSRHREVAADRTAALLTGSPAALAAALHRLAGELRGLPKTDLRVVAARDPLHLLPSRGDPTGLRRLWATHPPLADRLDRLERLERIERLSRPDGRYPLGSAPDRARRGISGALNPQSALAGLNSLLRGFGPGVSAQWKALMAGSRAMQAREPGQVRKEAALSGSL